MARAAKKTPANSARSVPRDLAPMEARLVDALPTDPGWQFEPKWDGFRCLALRDGDRVELKAKSGKPLARYFPEVVEMLKQLAPQRFVLDGELAIPVGDALSFDALQMRLHLRPCQRRPFPPRHQAGALAARQGAAAVHVRSIGAGSAAVETDRRADRLNSGRALDVGRFLHRPRHRRTARRRRAAQQRLARLPFVGRLQRLQELHLAGGQHRHG